MKKTILSMTMMALLGSSGVVSAKEQEYFIIVNEVYEYSKISASDGLSIESQSVVESDGKKTIILEMENGSDFTSSATIDYALSHITTTDDDLTLTSGTVSVKGGKIHIPIEGDVFFDHSRSFKITLSNPYKSKIGKEDAVITIDDNDAMPILNIESAVSMNESTSNMSMITVSGDTKRPMTVEYDVVPENTIASDFTSLSGSLTIQANEKTVLIPSLVSNDVTDEHDESFKVVLRNPVDATIGNDTSRVILLDDDIEVSASISDVVVTESDVDTIVPIELTLSAVSGKTVSVFISTRDVTAESGDDFSGLIAHQVDFLPGETSKTVDLTIKGDYEFESHETFEVYLHGETNASISKSTANVELKNNDVIYEFNTLPLYGIVEYNDGSGWQQVVENTEYSRVYDFRYNPTELEVLAVSRDISVGSFDTDLSTPYRVDGTHSMSEWGSGSGSTLTYNENGVTITTSLEHGNFFFRTDPGTHLGVGLGSTHTSSHLMAGEVVRIDLEGDFLNDVRIAADGLGSCYDFANACETKVEIRAYDHSGNLIDTQGGYRQATSGVHGEAFVDNYYFTGETAIKYFEVRTVATNEGGANTNLSSGSNTLLNLTVSRSAFEVMDYIKTDEDGNTETETLKLNINEGNANVNVDLNTVL